jgi:niacin transporter
MFISTDVAVAVVIGTTFGFFVSGFSPVVVARAFSHIVFATLGSLYLKHHPKTVHSSVKFHIFNFVIALVHALCEVVTVFAYYMIIGGMTGFMDSSGFKVLFLLVGLGTLVHSMVDFEIAGGIYQVLNKNRSFSLIFSNVHIPKTDKNNRLVSK